MPTLTENIRALKPTLSENEPTLSENNPKTSDRAHFRENDQRELNIDAPVSNGIKLASELLLDHLLTQFLPGFDHQREALGSPFLDARLHAMRSDGVDDQRA
jgi:hypothetical protein